MNITLKTFRNEYGAELAVIGNAKKPVIDFYADRENDKGRFYLDTQRKGLETFYLNTRMGFTIAKAYLKNEAPFFEVLVTLPSHPWFTAEHIIGVWLYQGSFNPESFPDMLGECSAPWVIGNENGVGMLFDYAQGISKKPNALLFHSAMQALSPEEEKSAFNLPVKEA
jgi:hypothetical protein